MIIFLRLENGHNYWVYLINGDLKVNWGLGIDKIAIKLY